MLWTHYIVQQNKTTMSQQSLKDKTIKGTMWIADEAFLESELTFQ